MPAFNVFSCRNRFNAMRRRIERFSAALPRPLRARSSSKTTRNVAVLGPVVKDVPRMHILRCRPKDCLGRGQHPRLGQSE